MGYGNVAPAPWIWLPPPPATAPPPAGAAEVDGCSAGPLQPTPSATSAARPIDRRTWLMCVVSRGSRGALPRTYGAAVTGWFRPRYIRVNDGRARSLRAHAL